MQKTEHYQLPHWEQDDPIKMDDFNELTQKVDAALSDIRAATGTYTGDGTMMADGGQEIALGFKPKFVVITRGWLDPAYNSQAFYVAGEAAVVGQELYFRLTDNGFRVGKTTEQLVDQIRNVDWVMTLNEADVPYSYIAFH